MHEGHGGPRRLKGQALNEELQFLRELAMSPTVSPPFAHKPGQSRLTILPHPSSGSTQRELMLPSQTREWHSLVEEGAKAVEPRKGLVPLVLG
jgi:hypothetical protein